MPYLARPIPAPKAARRVLRVVAAEAAYLWNTGTHQLRAKQRRTSMLRAMDRAALDSALTVLASAADRVRDRIGQLEAAPRLRKPGASAAPSPAKRASPASADGGASADAVTPSHVQEERNDRNDRSAG